MTRLRIRFSKTGKVRWTSHRDVARMWERAFRRVDLPVARTRGYTPRPRVSFGLALPTGHESLAEYLDVDLDVDVDLEIEPPVESLPRVLTDALPVGVEVMGVAPIDDRAPSLQQDVSVCRWEIDVPGAIHDLEGRVRALLAADRLVIDRERKGKVEPDDIRPGVVAVSVAAVSVEAEQPVTASAIISAELATQPRALRPSELLAALGLPPHEGRVIRTHQWIERDGARIEPLPLDATRAPYARLERAS